MMNLKRIERAEPVQCFSEPVFGARALLRSPGVPTREGSSDPWREAIACARDFRPTTQTGVHVASDFYGTLELSHEELAQLFLPDGRSADANRPADGEEVGDDHVL